ncbi:hypothetical protein WMY93_031335, partial [Mugilogobius chulae]
MQTYRCIHCPEKLHNNVSLMQHLNDHRRQQQIFSCCFCHRQIVLLFRLQRHLKAVHALAAPPPQVRLVKSRSMFVLDTEICEFEFEKEIALLLHMKNTHKPERCPTPV